LNLSPIPIGDQPGLYYKPSLLLSVSATTPNRDQAVRFVDFLINDPDGIKAIGLERGIPGSRKAQALLAPGFTPAQQKVIDFSNIVSKSGSVRLKEVLDPPSASQVATIFSTVATDVGTKKTTVVDGAKSFYDAAQKALLK
jgi:multiple sugar transport system substrate-binding protein